MSTPQTGAGDPRRSLELLWREDGAQEGRPGPKPRFTLEQVVATAIALADRSGVAALNMRAVADELGTGPMTLYRYVPGKAELLDLMVDRATEPAPEDLATVGSTWREHLVLLAEGTWDGFAAHPWLLEVNQRRPVMGPGSLAGFDWALRAFEGLDIPGREQNLIITGVMSIVIGAARDHLIGDSSDTPPPTTESEWWAAQEPYLIRASEGGDYPRLAAVNTDENAWNFNGREAMRFTLDAFLDGVGRRWTLDR